MSDIKPIDNSSAFSLPSLPSSVGSWLGNRVVSVAKVVVSAVTFVGCGLSLIAPIGKWAERASRVRLSFGTFFQGMRQFLYCADIEDQNQKYSSLRERIGGVLQIANIPANGRGGANEDLRSAMIGNSVIAEIFKRIIYPYSKPEAGSVENYGSLGSHQVPEPNA